MKLVTIVFLSIVVFITPAISQLLDKTKPSVYISFVKSADIPALFEGESDRRIWLTLNNNTRIPLFLCKASAPKGYGDVILPREVYQTGHSGKTLIPSLGFPLTDACSVLDVQSGKSVEFTVPAEELASGRLIRVPFHFGWAGSWEQDLFDQTESFVKFGADQIPTKSIKPKD